MNQKARVLNKEPDTRLEDTNDMVIFEEIQESCRLVLLLSIRDRVVDVVLERITPLPLPVDSSLGSWTTEEVLRISSTNPSLENLCRLWSNFSPATAITRKRLKEEIIETLKRNGVSTISIDTRLLR